MVAEAVEQSGSRGGTVRYSPSRPKPASPCQHHPGGVAWWTEDPADKAAGVQ